MIDSLISKTTWVTKIGHELTFVPTIHVSDSDKAFISDPDSCGWPYEYRMHLENVDYLFNAQIKRNRIDVADCGIDMHCIEISSKPLNSWKEFIGWNNEIRKIALKHQMVPDVDWIGGGMGHHHIDKQTDAVRDHLFRIVASRPYLAWVFLHPSDILNANSLSHWFTYLNSERGKNPLSYFSSRQHYNYPQGKGNVLSVRTASVRCNDVWYSYNDYIRTMEWRAFDSAVDMEQQVEHTAFLQALVGFAQRTAPNVASGKKLFKSIKEAKEVLHKYQNYDTCVRDWRDCLDALGLPRNRYEHYMEENVKLRLQWGNGI